MAIAMGWQKPDDVAGTSAPAIMVGLFVASGGILFGYDTGTINGILAMDPFIRQFGTGYANNGNSHPIINILHVSLVVAMLSAGTTVGALLAAPLGDHFGRRSSLIGASGIFCVGVVFQVCAETIAMLIAGRTIAGLGVGIVSVLVPLYQSEMAPKWIRGTLVCAYQLSITVGLLAAAVVNLFTSNLTTSASYRIPMGLQLVWACVLSLGMLILPETPRFLIKKGQKGPAALSLSRLRRLDITHPALQEELAEIEANHLYELTLGPDTYKELIVGQPHLGRRTLTGCVLQMLQQLTGINFIMYYSTTFFGGAGIHNPFTTALIVQVVNMASTVPGLLVVESWGRRNLLIIGAVGMAVCQLLIASFAAASGNNNKTAQNQILLIFVSIFIFFFGASWGPVGWVVTSEIYPLKVRAKSMSISTASNWLLNFGIAFGTPYMIGTGSEAGDLGSKVFFVWGAFCVVAAVFVWGMVYETSKISLEQIDEMYELVEYAWHSKQFEPSWSFQQMRDLGFPDSGPGEVAAAGGDQQLPQQQDHQQPQMQQHQQQQAQQQSYPTGHFELQPSQSRTSSNQRSNTAISGTTATSSQEEDKILSSMGHVDFSY